MDCGRPISAERRNRRAYISSSRLFTFPVALFLNSENKQNAPQSGPCADIGHPKLPRQPRSHRASLLFPIRYSSFQIHIQKKYPVSGRSRDSRILVIKYHCIRIDNVAGDTCSFGAHSEGRVSFGGGGLRLCLQRDGVQQLQGRVNDDHTHNAAAPPIVVTGRQHPTHWLPAFQQPAGDQDRVPEHGQLSAEHSEI